MKKIIDICELSFSSGNKKILNNISFHVDKGEYLGITGPNGAGKTTLLKCLLRIITGVTGSVEINGISHEKYTQRELAKILSYVPQTSGRVLEYTVHEFVQMGRYPHLGPFSSMTDEDTKTVNEALNHTDVVSLKKRKLETLSGGERQRVFIAAALAQGAKILLLDEPTTFLDPKYQSETNELLARLNRRLGLTLVAVTHDLNAAALWMDRIIALKDGEIAFSGTGSEFMCPETLEKIYDTKFVFTSHPETGFPCIVPGGELS